MKNVFKILSRDVMRLVKAPAALVVVAALIILPSAYTWYNVVGFWDPYSSTGNLRVCVVDEDAGGSNDLVGDIDVGQMIEDELRKNTELDWQFVDFDTAMEEVDSGASYAAFVIPSDFSEKLLTITTGDFDQPSIRYYVNEKTGPVAPKITDTGATTLDDTVNSEFVSTASSVVATALDDKLHASEEKFAESRSEAAQKISEGIQACEDAKSAIAEAKASADASRDKIGNAELAIGDVKSSMATAKSLLSDMSELSRDTDAAIDGIASAIAANEAANALEQAIEDMKAASPGGVASVIEDRQEAARAARASLDAAGDAATAAIAESASRVTSALDAQELLVDQVGVLLGRAKSASGTVAGALDATSGLVDSLEAALGTAHADVMSMEGASAVTDLLGEDGIDAAVIADFMASPTRIVTEKLYPLDSYGSAMAPLFMNLTLWIGAFMLMVVLRQEADSKGIDDLTFTQRYLGRFALFAVMVVLQAVVCCTGLMLLGVHPASPPALFCAAAVAALSYLSIIYALSVTLQHIGMGICVMLVFLQIPGATGLYPLEMTPEFFQAVYPLFPFTYGINAMREAICGFYGAQFAQNVGALALFFAVFFASGLVLRPLLANVNRMTAREIRDSGIFNSEDGEIPPRRYRFYQIMRALSDRPEYREELERRKARFDRIYPGLVKWTGAVGVLVPVVLTLVFTFTAAEKVVLLTLWLGWTILVFVFLIVVESLRFSIERQLRLYRMDSAKLHGLYRKQRVVSAASEGAVLVGEAPVSGDEPGDGGPGVTGGASGASGTPGDSGGGDAR